MSIEKEWVVQRCVNAFEDNYEDWSGYCEKLMSQAEMKKALDECNQKWPMHQFGLGLKIVWRSAKIKAYIDINLI